MKKNLIITLLLGYSISGVLCQNGGENFKEGLLLHRLESASIYAKSNFKSNFKSLYNKNIKDVSHVNSKEEIETLIFEDIENPVLLARYKFDSLPDKKHISIETNDLEIISIEDSLIELLADGLKKIDDKYKGNFYETSGMYFRVVPLIMAEKRKVIVFTRPIKKSKSVILGNDYELVYDSLGNFMSIKRFHDNIIRIPFNTGGNMTTVHKHQTNDEISPTDVCTLLLYADKVNWRQHIVLNPKYVAILDIKRRQTIFMMRQEFDETMKKVNN